MPHNLCLRRYEIFKSALQVSEDPSVQESWVTVSGDKFQVGSVFAKLGITV